MVQHQITRPAATIGSANRRTATLLNIIKNVLNAPILTGLILGATLSTGQGPGGQHQ